MPRRPALDSPPAPATEPPSKTQRKQAMQALQQLGEALAALPRERRVALALPEPLAVALDELPRIRSHEGLRRQRQLIGKLMRGVDPAPVREAIAAAQLGGARDALALHEAERWREALLADDAAAGRWQAEHPHGDLQQLRSLVRAARREGGSGADAEAPPGSAPRKGRAYRELFRFLRAARPDERTDDHPSSPDLHE